MKNQSFYFYDYVDRLTNLNDKSKAKFWAEILKADWGISVIDNPTLFSSFDKDYLLQCVKKYLSTCPSRSAANDYRRTVLWLCNSICKDYNMRNAFLDSTSEQDDFSEITKKWIAALKKPESREAISTEDFKTLNTIINDFLSNVNLEMQIAESVANTNLKPNYYGWLVSSIALRLIQEFGLSNQSIVSIQLNDLDIKARSLIVNDFHLRLNNDIAAILELYLKYRTLVIHNCGYQQDLLFIKRTGTPYLDVNGNPDSGQLFLVLDSTLGHTTTTTLRHRTIIELVSRGANIFWLSQLTGVKKETIVDLCADDRSNLEILLQNATSSLKTIPQAPGRGLLRCPYCGEYREAGSENWILIQVGNESKKYIACRECKGLDGKYRY